MLVMSLLTNTACVLLKLMLCMRVYTHWYQLFLVLLLLSILVRAAHQFGADTIAHGCTGKGNDQVRFRSIHSVY